MTRMARGCQLVIPAGEDLGRIRERWGRHETKVLRLCFGLYTQSIQDVPELLLLNGGEADVIPQDKKKICFPGCRLFRMREEKLPHFRMFPLIQSVRSCSTSVH
jgi:hypothetical protein